MAFRPCFISSHLPITSFLSQRLPPHLRPFGLGLPTVWNFPPRASHPGLIFRSNVLCLKSLALTGYLMLPPCLYCTSHSFSDLWSALQSTCLLHVDPLPLPWTLTSREPWPCLSWPPPGPHCPAQGGLVPSYDPKMFLLKVWTAVILCHHEMNQEAIRNIYLVLETHLKVFRSVSSFSVLTACTLVVYQRRAQDHGNLFLFFFQFYMYLHVHVPVCIWSILS